MATIPAHENEYPLVIFVEGAAPGTPPAGMVYVYVKSDGLLYWKDDAGTERQVSAGDLAAHLADTADAHDASAISFSPTGTVAATDVQAAIAEVASEAGSGVSDLDDLSDVVITSPSAGEVLTYDGAQWENAAAAGGSAGAGALVTEATQNVAHNTLTKLTFGTEAYDDAAFHSGGNPTRLTAPATGRYRVGFGAFFGFSQSNELDYLIQKNGTSGVSNALWGDTRTTTTGKYVAFMFDCALTSGDYLEVECYHDNGSTRAVTKAQFSIQRID